MRNRHYDKTLSKKMYSFTISNTKKFDDSKDNICIGARG